MKYILNGGSEIVIVPKERYTVYTEVEWKKMGYDKHGLLENCNCGSDIHDRVEECKCACHGEESK